MSQSRSTSIARSEFAEERPRDEKGRFLPLDGSASSRSSSRSRSRSRSRSKSRASSQSSSRPSRSRSRSRHSESLSALAEERPRDEHGRFLPLNEDEAAQYEDVPRDERGRFVSSDSRSGSSRRSSVSSRSSNISEESLKKLLKRPKYRSANQYCLGVRNVVPKRGNQKPYARQIAVRCDREGKYKSAVLVYRSESDSESGESGSESNAGSDAY